MDCGVELNCANKGDGASSFEVAFNRGKKMVDVDSNVNKDIKSLNLGDVDRNQTGVGVVNQNIAAKSAGSVVVDTTCAICYIAHYEGGDAGTELGENIGDGGCEKKEAGAPKVINVAVTPASPPNLFEENGKTRIVSRTTYASASELEQVMAMGMEEAA